QVRKEPADPASHIYLNIQELQEEAAAGGTTPAAHTEPHIEPYTQPHAEPHAEPHTEPHIEPHIEPRTEHRTSSTDWETYTDTDSGHLFYYNPTTGETTWDCPFEQEDGVSPGASPSSPALSPQLAEWGRYVDEGSGQAFFYNSVTGETSWDPPAAGDGSQKMYPGLYSPAEQRPPTPETDYPDLSPDELEGDPEEDYSPLGSYEQGGASYLPPRHPE
ncbi:RHG27 protein, partial [Penelope pileata]|nr:RHG27 protein [Penelope pileata]